ncbi:MAG: hypothetical protein RL346_2094 [Verrucomicrobiota bacterium]
MGKCMVAVIRKSFGCLWFATSLCAQDLDSKDVPREVVESAGKAVELLGKEVVAGKYQAAIDQMYPQWKERTAKRLGGMEKLEGQLRDVASEMRRRGITITDFRPQGEPQAFQVYPGKQIETIGGREVESMRFTKWLVLVPTVTRFRMLLEGDPVPVNIESTGFQVAIADKGKNEWFFIDGSGIAVSDLRGLFITLPENLQLPPIEKKQIK